MKPTYGLFPINAVKDAIDQYIQAEGKAPKVLVAATEDYTDWIVTSTIHEAEQLNLTVTYAEYLEPGEFDLAMGFKNDSN